MTYEFIGIDPGLWDTGIVRFRLDFRTACFDVGFHSIREATPEQVAQAVTGLVPARHVYIEAYRPRHKRATDTPMIELVAGIAEATGGLRVPNQGVNQSITRHLMELFDVWHFPLSTHHNDLRAAARIGLFGELKHNETFNTDLAQFISSGEYLDIEPVRAQNSLHFNL